MMSGLVNPSYIHSIVMVYILIHSLMHQHNIYHQHDIYHHLLINAQCIICYLAINFPSFEYEECSSLLKFGVSGPGCEEHIGFMKITTTKNVLKAEFAQ